jgi:hypothetical protein
VRAISDNLSDQDVKDIENSETEYSDIKSYIKQGPEKDDSSYVVYASYEYINPSLYVKHPGLSWLYVKRNDAGEYKIIVDASSDEKLTAYVNEISAEADVKALVDEITEASKKADADEQAAAEAAGTAQADAGETESAAPESPAPEAEETPKEETAGAEEAEQAPAAPEESEEKGQEEDTESEESLGYNNEFPDDGAPEHSAVIGSTCNLRAGAGYNYKVVTVLEQGTPITVIGEVSKGWYHISCEAGEGYIGTRFVDFG